MTSTDILRDTRNFLNDHHHWTKGESARDSRGLGVNIHSPSACRFCTLGALARLGKFESNAHAYFEALIRLGTVTRLMFDRDIIETNDVLGRKAILKALDYALDNPVKA